MKREEIRQGLFVRINFEKIPVSKKKIVIRNRDDFFRKGKDTEVYTFCSNSFQNGLIINCEH